MTRRLHTGIITFIQNAPIIWFSKKYNTVKVNKFGSELVALSICKDLTFVLRYKLWMFGVRLEGPAYFYVIIVELLRKLSSHIWYSTKNTTRLNIIQFMKKFKRVLYKLGKVVESRIWNIC